MGKLLYDARFGDTWQLVQTMLGHRSVITTMDVYLEPFRHLDVELLLEQTVGLPIAALLDEVWRQHQRWPPDRCSLVRPAAKGLPVVARYGLSDAVIHCRRV